MNKKRLYIAYGSNLNIRQMAMRCPTAKIVGTGELKNYELQFKGYPTSAFATIEQCKGSTVPVLIWELKQKDEMALDLYEGCPSHYYKKDMLITVGDRKAAALVYIMAPKNNFGIPTHHYYNTILEGYDKAGFDVNILNDAVDKSIAEYRKLENTRINLYDFDDLQENCKDDEEQSDEEENQENEFDYDNQLHL
jgi:gamma-glutamylcyclotransferase (GGCT)/AIG2-like uncharacterized protein YtfP